MENKYTKRFESNRVSRAAQQQIHSKSLLEGNLNESINISATNRNVGPANSRKLPGYGDPQLGVQGRNQPKLVSTERLRA